MRLDLILERGDRTKPRIPARFQLSRHQAIVGIDRIVLAPGTRGLIARLLQAKLKLMALLLMCPALGQLCLECRLYTERLQSRDDLGADRLIDPHAPERDAARATMIELAAAAVVTPGVAAFARIGDVKFAPAMAASQKPGQKSFATSYGAATGPELSCGVVRDQPLVPLVRVPSDVSAAAPRRCDPRAHALTRHHHPAAPAQTSRPAPEKWRRSSHARLIAETREVENFAPALLGKFDPVFTRKVLSLGGWLCCTNRRSCLGSDGNLKAA
jgi:hypothetical protein